MPFTVDKEYLDDTDSVYGNYLATFTSPTGQVEARVFQEGRDLVAHVSFPTGLEAWEVTDKWVADLDAFAEGKGLKGNLKIVYHPSKVRT